MNCNIKECKAACCGPVPMDLKLIEKHKDKLNPGSKLFKEGEMSIHFNPATFNCGFLNPNHKCSIYEDRPDLCKRFGDPKEENRILKCIYLGQIGSQEQELSMNTLFKRR